MGQRGYDLAVVLTAALLTAAGLAALWTGSRATTLLWLLAAFVPYSVLFVARPASGRPWLVLVLAATAGAVMVPAGSLLSDDIYRYVWDGRMLAAGIDPYAHPPDAPELTALRDGLWARINHRSIPTIYPPLAQLHFGIAQLLGGGASVLKVLALLWHLAAAAVVSVLVRTHPPRSDAVQRAVPVLALNPLALSASALGGHVDGAIGLAVVGVAWALWRQRWGAAAGWIAVTSGFKLLGLVLWPLLWRRSRAWSLVALVVSLAALAPLVNAGYASDSSAPGVSHYAQRWRGNEGPFLMIEAAARRVVAAMATEPARELGPDEVELGWLTPLWPTVAGSALDPNRVYLGERKAPKPPAVFDRGQLTAMLARMLAALLVLCCCLTLAAVRASPAHALRVVLLAVLLLSPQVHPWYLLWLLPLEAALGRHAVVIWSAAAMVAYAPLDMWHDARVWQEPHWGRALQYGLVGVALIAESMVGYRRCASVPTVASS